MFTLGFLKTAKAIKMRATPAKHGGSDGRKTYTLKQEGKKWTCTCPDYMYRQSVSGGECKHIKAHKTGKKAWEIKKSASFDHNNQGLEFKLSDTDNTNGSVGPGGMGPSGEATYQPVEPTGKGRTAVEKKALGRMIMSKLYKLGGMENAALSDSSGSGIASGTVDQLKYTTQNGPTLESEAADNKEQKNRRKSYIKARLR
jgi:hypothetical protein